MGGIFRNRSEASPPYSRSRGQRFPSFAYVEIQDSIPVADAVQKLNGHNIRERMITVSEARNRVTAA